MVISEDASFSYKTKHIDCNLCGEDNVYIMFSGFSFDRRRYNHVRCKNCGLIYADPMPILSTQALDNIAMEVWNKDFLKDKNSFDRNHFENYREYNRLRVKELQSYKKQGKLLEVGCGNGYFLAEARENDWQVYGVEVCRDLSIHIRKYLNLDIFIGTLEEAKFPDGFFDAVYLNHLLEHLTDPLGFLSEVNRILKDDGVVFIGSPNAKDFLNALNKIITRSGLRRSWSGYLCPPMHLCAFTPHTLTKLLEKAGFKILDIFTIIQGDRTYFPDYSKWCLKKMVKRMVAFPGLFLGGGAHIEVYAAKQ